MCGKEGRSPGPLQRFGPEQNLMHVGSFGLGHAPGSSSGHVAGEMLSGHPGRDGEEADGSRARAFRGSLGRDKR